MPLQQFEHILVEGVRLAHVASQQPFHVAGNAHHAVEVEGAKAHPHQVLAFSRGLGLVTVHGPEVGKHLLDHRDALGGLRDPRVAALRGRLGRRGGRLRFPHPQRPELWVGRNQLAQGGGARARQTEDDDRALDHLVGDLGVLLVGLHDLQPLDEGVADGGVLHDAAEVVEFGFGVQGVDGALEALAVVGRAEVVEPGGRPRAVFECVSGKAHRENLWCTARRRASMTCARSADVVIVVSAGSAATTSSTFTTRVSGTGAVFVRTQRKSIAPLLWPAVSSQFATPGSVAEMTARKTPSGSMTA